MESDVNHAHRPGWRRAWAVLGCALLLATAARADDPPPAGMTEQVVEVPKPAGIFTIRLETTIFKPAGDGPFR